ncbi:MAG TPA: Mur ligase family protein, partial [Myxococcota bacterium]|nr:Mur ligase family protein [Myxococcota bacterium]
TDLEHCRGPVPVGLVTGTNGKTTTTRMTAAILKAAGHRVGATSTDAITLDGAVVEEGDWTGPGAARKVLRHPEVTAAVLETARGGIL